MKYFLSILISMVCFVSLAFGNQEVTSQKLALDTWDIILKAQANKSRVTRAYVQRLAGQIKTGESDYKGKVQSKDLKEAIYWLNETSFLVADRYVGNKNGECSVEEWILFSDRYKEQLAVIFEMATTF